MLSLPQVNDICLNGQGKSACRFLASDISGYFCLKKTFRKDQINAEVDALVKKASKNNLDLDDLGFPMGDNCSGYVFFKQKIQGYDIF